MKNNRWRFPAEWEHDCAILVAWPHTETDWADMLDDIRRCYCEMIDAFTVWHDVIVVAPNTTDSRQMLNGLKYRDRIFYVNVPTNDTWTRDYGPLTVECQDGSFRTLDFCFNGWGMKFAACHDNLVNSHLKDISLISAPLINCRDFVLEGGGIESDGCGSLMTTAHCQLSPNRNATLSREQISDRLLHDFGASQILWINHGYLAGDDTDSHVDTLARFAPRESILYVGCSDPTDEHFEELKLMRDDIFKFRTLDGNPFNLFELPLPDPIYDDSGDRLPATYANFLATPRAVFMPVYGQPMKDELARQIISVAFERPVVTVDCRPLIRQHGSLHCATMQLPRQIIAWSDM